MLEAEQLAPFDALVDQAYPDNLRMVAEWLYVQLVEDEEIVEIPISAERLTKLALLALRQTERLSAEIGGGNFYLAKGVSYRASLRDRQMFERFNGRNYDTLARAYNLTPMRVRQIIGAMMADEIGRRQGKLELG